MEVRCRMDLGYSLSVISQERYNIEVQSLLSANRKVTFRELDFDGGGAENFLTPIFPPPKPGFPNFHARWGPCGPLSVC